MHGMHYPKPAGTVFDSGRLFYYNGSGEFGVLSWEFGAERLVHNVHPVHLVHLIKPAG